jgi:hypothetical protein
VISCGGGSEVKPYQVGEEAVAVRSCSCCQCQRELPPLVHPHQFAAYMRLLVTDVPSCVCVATNGARVIVLYPRCVCIVSCPFSPRLCLFRSHTSHQPHFTQPSYSCQ